jgi:hypothetical protein
MRRAAVRGRLTAAMEGMRAIRKWRDFLTTSVFISPEITETPGKRSRGPGEAHSFVCRFIITSIAISDVAIFMPIPGFGRINAVVL